MCLISLAHFSNAFSGSRHDLCSVTASPGSREVGNEGRYAAPRVLEVLYDTQLRRILLQTVNMLTV